MGEAIGGPTGGGGGDDGCRAQPVSRREAEVQALVAEHLSNAEIADRLYISERTVESHVSALLRKLGVADRAALGRAWRRGAPDHPTLPVMLELHAEPATFVGRSGELSALRDRWDRARDGHTLLVVVGGEAGIGKSRLVSEFAAEAHAEGARVLYGACFEDVGDAYGPIAQAIADEMADRPELIARLDSDDREALRLLAPQVARALTEGGRWPAGRDGKWIDQDVVFDAVERWLLAPCTPTLLVIEDLHWSTPSTHALLQRLVRRAGRSPLLIVATTRDTPPEQRQPLLALLGELERSPATSRISLHGLPPDDVATLLQVDAETAEVVFGETGGNPLLVRHLSGDRGSLAGLLDRREEVLDGESRALLDLASTMGAEFDVGLLAAGHGAPLVHVLESLERAEAAGLVVARSGQPVRYGFVHALFRTHRYERLSLRRRMELHASAAAALDAHGADASQLGELARHACLSVPLTDAGTACRLARQAGLLAEQAYAYDEAVTHYRRGLDALGRTDPPEAHAVLDLTGRLAAALRRNRDPLGLPMLLDVAEQARRDGATDVLVRAATSLSHLGAASTFGRVDHRQVAVVEHALAALDPGERSTRARLLVELAVQLDESDLARSIEAAEEAESIARESQDPELLGTVLMSARHVARHPARLEFHLQRARELERLGNELQVTAFTLAGLNSQALLHLERGDLPASDASWRRFLSVLGDRPLPFFRMTSFVYRAGRALLQGDLAQAEELAMATIPLSVEIGYPPGSWAGPTLGAVRRLQARDHEVMPLVRRLADRPDAPAVYRCVLAATSARVGAVDDARRLLAGIGDVGNVPPGYGWALAMSELAEGAEVTGSDELAAAVIAACRAHSGLNVVSGSAVQRPFDQALAQAALGLGDAAQAEHYAARAVAASRRRDTPMFLARELVFLAEARRRRGGSVADLAPLVDEARALAARFGARVVDEDLERYARRG